MKNIDICVRARTDANTKNLVSYAWAVWCDMYSRVVRVVGGRRPSCNVKVPNTKTSSAIAELESGRGEKFSTVDELMTSLYADN